MNPRIYERFGGMWMHQLEALPRRGPGMGGEYKGNRLSPRDYRKRRSRRLIASSSRRVNR